MKFKFKNSILFKLRYFIVFIISVLFGFYLYTIPSISYKFFNLNNKHFKNLTTKDLSKKENVEIFFSPYIINNNFTPSLDIDDFDVTLGIPLSKKNINLSKVNFSPTILIKGDSKIINNKKSKLLDSDNFSKVDIQNNSIVFMYLDKNLHDSASIISFSKIIKDYKSKNYFIILYIKSKIQITSKTIDLLCNEGVNLIFSPSITNTYIESRNKSIIIYGVENNSYIPQFDIVFNNHKPIALGVKFAPWNMLSDNIIEDIERHSKNLPFKISRVFSFFDY